MLEGRRKNVKGKKENGKLEDVEKRRKGKVMSIKMRNGIANGEMRGRKGGGRLLVSPCCKTFHFSLLQDFSFLSFARLLVSLFARRVSRK